jgi:hypothetical protein
LGKALPLWGGPGLLLCLGAGQQSGALPRTSAEQPRPNLEAEPNPSPKRNQFKFTDEKIHRIHFLSVLFTFHNKSSKFYLQNLKQF